MSLDAWIREVWGSLYASVFDWYSSNQQIADITIVLAVVGILSAGYMWDVRRRRRLFNIRRGGQMTRAERQYYKKLLVSTILTDGLEDAEFHGKISRLEVQELYKKIGKFLMLGELIPQVNKGHPSALRAMLTAKKAASTYHKPNLPGDKPPPVVANVLPFPSPKVKAFGKFLARRKVA
jgi:hypothetical protein